MPLKCVIRWPDTGQEEEGVEMNRNPTDILFHSNWDGTINWVPKEYEVIEK